MSDEQPNVPVSDKTIQQLRILMMAIPGGLMPFLIVVCFLYFVIEPSGDTDLNMMVIFTASHFALIGLTFPVGLFLFRSILASDSMKKNIKQEKQLAVESGITNAYVIRSIAWEIAPILGIITIFMSISSGIIDEKPLLWANAMSPIAFFALHLSQLPTRQRIIMNLKFFNVID